MSPQIYVYDPTIKDLQSKVRGVGRYLQILRESFSDKFIFSDTFPSKSKSSTIFINPFFNMLQSPLSIRKIAKRQVAIIHDLIPLKYPTHFPIGFKGKLNVFLNRLDLHSYDLIITDSSSSKKDIMDILGLPDNKIKVVYPCLPKIFTDENVKTTTQISNLQTMTDYCLYVGDATWNKNLVNIAKAIKLADIPCIFVGKVFGDKVLSDKIATDNMWRKELNEFNELAKNDKRFIFPGFVSDERLINLYQQAYVNILVSKDEGFGFSCLEAASQACPSLLSDSHLFHEISKDSARFVNPINPEEIAQIIKSFVLSPELRSEFGALALERSKLFSMQKFKKDFLETVQSA